MAIGDILMMTSAIRDFKTAYPDRYLIRVVTTAQHLWDYNPYLTDFDEPDMVVKIGPRKFVNGSQTRGLHYVNAFRESMETNLNLPIPQGHIKPDLHLSSEEKDDRLIEGKYWIIIAGGKADFTTKIWPIECWQEVIASFPDITFVQVGEAKHNHPVLEGDNVINSFTSLRSKEDDLIRNTLLNTNNNVSKAAKILNIDRTTIYRRRKNWQ